MEKDVISCELHDFVEVACMYKYQLKLTLKNGEVIEGKAIDILSINQQERLVVDDSGEKKQVDLMVLAKMQVLTPNAKFSEVVF
ncbi:MAG: Rho-binding antiterminator [Nitrosomonas sp.]|jgi:Rho-binding antiterminator|nr:Rho-binding antiterminator [Nitrosomonas sp.]MDR4520704.1 Rho-binding antiterminator [Nitrosomonas sp.]MDR4653193.1 Rho-binding antiterminator [Nitrosomonas sp.]